MVTVEQHRAFDALAVQTKFTGFFGVIKILSEFLGIALQWLAVAKAQVQPLVSSGPVESCDDPLYLTGADTGVFAVAFILQLSAGCKCTAKGTPAQLLSRVIGLTVSLLIFDFISFGLGVVTTVLLFTQCTTTIITYSALLKILFAGLALVKDFYDLSELRHLKHLFREINSSAVAEVRERSASISKGFDTMIESQATEITGLQMMRSVAHAVGFQKVPNVCCCCCDNTRVIMELHTDSHYRDSQHRSYQIKHTRSLGTEVEFLSFLLLGSYVGGVLGIGALFFAVCIGCKCTRASYSATYGFLIGACASTFGFFTGLCFASCYLVSKWKQILRTHPDRALSSDRKTGTVSFGCFFLIGSLFGWLTPLCFAIAVCTKVSHGKLYGLAFASFVFNMWWGPGIVGVVAIVATWRIRRSALDTENLTTQLANPVDAEVGPPANDDDPSPYHPEFDVSVDQPYDGSAYVTQDQRFARRLGDDIDYLSAMFAGSWSGLLSWGALLILPCLACNKKVSYATIHGFLMGACSTLFGFYTGMGFIACYSGYRWLWLLRHHPDREKAARAPGRRPLGQFGRGGWFLIGATGIGMLFYPCLFKSIRSHKHAPYSAYYSLLWAYWALGGLTLSGIPALVTMSLMWKNLCHTYEQHPKHDHSQEVLIAE